MYVAKTGASQYTGHETQTAVERNQLDKHDFLRLLTTQLKHQDPMNPIKDQDFIAQLAQFTALEQTQNLAQAMEKFVESQEKMGLISQATSLLGKEVVVVNSDTEQAAAGLVSAIQFTDGVPQLVVDGQAYFLWEVQTIKVVS
ncbi:MAG: flagellar hook capping protein [Firmicutes bacterium]|nr:flagellar hook capping protein [Bacillota bacterium]